MLPSKTSCVDLRKIALLLLATSVYKKVDCENSEFYLFWSEFAGWRSGVVQKFLSATTEIDIESEIASAERYTLKMIEEVNFGLGSAFDFEQMWRIDQEISCDEVLLQIADVPFRLTSFWDKHSPMDFGLDDRPEATSVVNEGCVAEADSILIKLTAYFKAQLTHQFWSIV